MGNGASVIAQLAARAGISYAAVQGRLRRCDGYTPDRLVEITPEVEAEILRPRRLGGPPAQVDGRAMKEAVQQRERYDPSGKIAAAALAYHLHRFGPDRAKELAAYHNLVAVLEPSTLRYAVVQPRKGNAVLYRCVNGEIVCERKLGRMSVYAPTAHEGSAK